MVAGQPASQTKITLCALRWDKRVVFFGGLARSAEDAGQREDERTAETTERKSRRWKPLANPSVQKRETLGGSHEWWKGGVWLWFRIINLAGMHGATEQSR